MPQFQALEAKDREARTILIERIKELSLKYGDFTLKSGAKSHYYLDLRNTMLDILGLKATSHLIAGIVNSNNPDAIGGVELGAVPIVAGVLSSSNLRWRAKGFIVRKQAKEHGTQKLIEGPVEPGQSVIIIEDVITSGGSTITAIKAAQEFGLKVKSVVAVMDRLQGGHDAIQAFCPITTLLTTNDLKINPASE